MLPYSFGIKLQPGGCNKPRYKGAPLLWIIYAMNRMNNYELYYSTDKLMI